MTKFILKFKNVTTKSYTPVIERTVTVEAYNERHARQLLHSRFGNENKIEITSVIEDVIEESDINEEM